MASIPHVAAEEFCETNLLKAKAVDTRKRAEDTLTLYEVNRVAGNRSC
jgi:hypothetical protein